MDLVTVLLRHSGKWVSEIRYDNYRIDGIVIHEKILYRDLMNAISIQLKIDVSLKRIHAKYVVQGNSSVLEIHNDIVVKLFLQILKAETIFGKYSLCITTSDIVINSDDVDADDMTIECYDFVEPSELAVVVVGNVESLPVVNVGGEELISDCYNSVVKVNQKYKNKATLVSVMHNYAIKHMFNFRAERSDKQSWVFKASYKHGTDTFIVRIFNDEHTCSIMDRVFKQQHAIIVFVAGIKAPKLVNYKRIITPSDIIEDIKRELGLDIDYIKVWRTKERALKILRGRPADRCKKIPTYVYMLNSVYPNSHIRMLKSSGNQFMYLLVALQPFIRNIGYCRPVVVVDGSHIRGPYQGTFVLASTLDGAGHILRIRESTNYIYGVYEEGRKYIVRLDNRTCNC
ncbi:hypothetical protein P3L10_005189 [Capsicum annuum]